MKVKRILVTLTFIVIIYSLSFTTVSAQTATPTATVSDDKVTQFKERIATQVAKLNIIKKRGITGLISDTSNNQLILIDMKGNKRFVDVDELTKFQDLAGRQIGISDLKKENQTSVIGLYNTESRRLLARFIRVRYPLARIVGEVMDIDKKNFTLEVLDEQTRDSKVVDVEAVTKTFEVTKSGGLAKSGFTKIQVGEKILIIGFPGTKDKFTASRILLFPELSPNIKLSPTITPTP